MEKTLIEIAESVKGELKGNGDVLIRGVNSLDKATSGEITFFSDVRYNHLLGTSKASALLVSNPASDFKGPQIVVSNPKIAYARVADLFTPPMGKFSGISEKAVIDQSAVIGKDVSIYPLVYIGKETIIGNNVILFPGTFVDDRVKIGDGTVTYPNVTILHDCIIGRDVIIHAGCVIGSDGFGFEYDGTEMIKIPQLGIVQIDDKVELGANNTIDRATNGKTWVKSGVKTDNLVQIAHNVEVGENTRIVSQSGVSGSTRIGREVLIGGQTGIGDHLEISDGTMIGSKSGVYQSISTQGIVSGIPSMPHKLWLKTRSIITRLPKIYNTLQSLEKRVKNIEQRLK